MRHYHPSNKSHRIFLLVLLLAFSGFVISEEANAVAPPPSGGEEFAYARLFSAKILGGLDKPLDELKAIAREHGTEEVIMFLPSDGPEKHTERWIIRLGSDEHAYPPGLTVKARTHLAKQQKAGVLEMKEAGRRATEVLPNENARLEWAFPESVRSPLSCVIFENDELQAVNTIHERLSPSAKQRWPEVILIDLPRRDWGIIQVFEYLDGRPNGLPAVQEEPAGLSAGEIDIRPADSEDTEGPGASSDGEEVEKEEPLLFSDSWPFEGFDESFDSGWQPRGCPVQLRFEMDAAAKLSVEVWGEFDLSYYPSTHDGNLMLPAGSGNGELEMNFGVEMSTKGRVKVDLGLKDVDFRFNIPYAPNFDFRCYDTKSFDSYFVDSANPIRVSDYIDPQELFSMEVAGVPRIASVTAAAMARMDLWAEMWTDTITTDSIPDPCDPCDPCSEHCEFTSEGEPCSVVLRNNNEYVANADYDENLEMGMIITFYPEICVGIDVWIYEWDYCVSLFALPVPLYDGSLDLNLSSEVHFEPTYDLMLTTSGYGDVERVVDGNTVAFAPGVYSCANDTDPCKITVIAMPNVNHAFYYWIIDNNDIVLDFNDSTMVEFSEANEIWFHSLHAVFFRAWATEPFPNDEVDKTGKHITLSWVPGERATYQDVYFGTSFNDVDDANSSYLMGPNEVYRDRLDVNDTDYIVLEELIDCETYYWRVDEGNDVCDPNLFWKGNVWCFRTVGCCASEPGPPNLSADEPRNVVLSWEPGVRVADVNHYLYLGTDFNDVKDANISDANIYQGVWDPNSCTIPVLAPNLPTTYYWRVDEGNDAYQNDPNEYIKYPWKGPVWELTVKHVIVEDFERYSDTNENEPNMHATWKVTRRIIDANFGIDMPTGAQIWLETGLDLVHGGEKSMGYDYNNDFWEDGNSCYYSEIEANTTGPNALEVNDIGGDWTSCNIKAMVLQFYGLADNDCTENERLYVVLEDNDSPTGRGVVQCDRDANNMNEWNLDLSDPNLYEVNLANIKKLYIGFGQKDNITTSAGSGTVWFDDIRLYPPRCRPEHAAPEGDISGGDCFVDEEDLDVMARDWLRSDYIVAANEPNRDYLVVEYTFNQGNLNDSSGNNYHGVGVNSPVVSGGFLTLNGSNSVEIGGDFNNVEYLFDGSRDFSIAIQFRTETPGILISSARDSNPDNHSMAVFVSKLAPNRGEVRYGNFARGTVGSEDNPLDNEWHHVVVTYETETGHRVYLDGGAGWDSEFDPNIPNANLDTVCIGGSRNSEFPNVNAARDLDLDFVGDINSVQIYDSALSAEEVCRLLNETKGCSFGLFDCNRPCYQPLKSAANLVPRSLDNIYDPNTYELVYNPNDLNMLDIVNFKDYAALAVNWLEEILWPLP